MSEKIKQLYDTLRSEGADVGTEAEFKDWFFKPGKEGYDNRKSVYNALKADGHDVAATYEGFRDQLGLMPKSKADKIAAERAEQQKAAAEAVAKARKTAREAATAPVVAEEKEAAPTPPAKTETTPVATAKQRAAEPVRLDSGKVVKNPYDISGAMRGDTSARVMDRLVDESADPSLRQRHEEESSEELRDRIEAGAKIEAEKAAKEKARADKVRKESEERQKKLEALREKNRARNESGVFRSMYAHGVGVANAGTAEEEQSRAEGAMLQSAIRSEEEVQRLAKDEADRIEGNAPGFWKEIGRMSVDEWDFGLSDAAETLGKLRAAHDPESEIAQMALKSTMEEQQARQDYGTHESWWQTAGSITRQSLPFVRDMMIMAPATKGLQVFTKLGNKAAVGMMNSMGKEAAKKAGMRKIGDYIANEGAVRGVTDYAMQKTLPGLIKATGTTADKLLLRGPAIANTIQAGQTASDVAERKLGDVYYNEKKRRYEYTNDKSLGTALWEGEANAAIENASEMMGGSIDKMIGKGAKLARLDKAADYIGGKIRDTFGIDALTRVATTADKAGLKAIANKAGEFLNRGEIQGIFGEIGEEYNGQIWRTIMDLDDAYEQQSAGTDENGKPIKKRGANALATADFHKNVMAMWLSVPFTKGLTAAVTTPLGVAEYYGAKNRVMESDKAAVAALGSRWNSLRDDIDCATNEMLPDFMTKVAHSDMTAAQKDAVGRYVHELMTFRGLNLAQVSEGRVIGEREGTEARRVASEAFANESYSNGYNEQPEKRAANKRDADKMADDARAALGIADDKEEQKWFEENLGAGLADISAGSIFDRIDALRGDGRHAETEAAKDLVEARLYIAGAMASADHRAQMSASEIAGDINQSAEGAVRTTVKMADGSEARVISGRLAWLDNNTPDKLSSDGTIIVKRQGGQPEMVSADDISMLLAEEDARELTSRAYIAEYAMNLREIDGLKRRYEKGDQFAITAQDGTETPMTVFSHNPADGIVIAETQDGMLRVVPEDDVDKYIAAVQAPQQPTEAQAQPTEAQAAAGEYKLNDTIRLQLPGGEVVDATVTSEIDMDGYVELETHNSEGKRMSVLYTPEELDAMRLEEQPAEERQTALSMIPTKENGKPDYEAQGLEAGTVWDALVESKAKHGDKAASLAKEYAEHKVAEYEQQLADIMNPKKFKQGKDEEFDDYQDRRESAAALAQGYLDRWKKVLDVAADRESAAEAEASEQRRAEEERLRAEEEQRRAAAAEEERLRREARRLEEERLNGIPDMADDTPENARARGMRRYRGQLLERQAPLDVPKGKEVQIKFGEGETPTGRIAIIDASQLQPSHIDKERNPLHFITEAQPKNRTNNASQFALQKIAKNMRLEEITGSISAYMGAPTVNARGETIQGNNRSAALKLMHESYPEQAAAYKQYLIDNAEKFGLKAEDIEGVENPVLVNMLDVEDQEAIRLGQFVQSDTESGGVERIKAPNLVNKMGGSIAGFVRILLRSDSEDASVSELIEENGIEALKWLQMKGYITPTQYESCFDSRGNLKEDARTDLRNILYENIFTGGNESLRDDFASIPAKAQRAILAVAHRDHNIEESDKLKSEIQDSIKAYVEMQGYPDIAAAGNVDAAIKAVDSWSRQYSFDDMSGKSLLPSEKYSNFALRLAALYRGASQGYIQAHLNKIYDLMEGVKDDMFAEDTAPKHLKEAIREVFGIEYNKPNKKENETNRDSDVGSELPTGERGGPGSQEADRDREREAPTGGAAESGRGAQSDSEQIEEGEQPTAVTVQSPQQSVETAPGNAEEEAELTGEEIDASDLPDEVKDIARSWLEGNRSPLVTATYKTVKDYVRSRSTDSEQNSGSAGSGTQLGATADEDKRPRKGGQSRSADAGLDRKDDAAPSSTQRQSGTDSEGDMAESSGVGSDTAVSGRTSGKSGLDSGANGSTKRGSARSGRSDVRKSSGNSGSRGRATQDENGGTETGHKGNTPQSGPTGEINLGRTSDSDLDAEIADILGEIKDLLKNPPGLDRNQLNDVTTVIASLGVAGFKVLALAARLGAKLVSKGFRTLNRWREEMKRQLGPVLKGTRLSDRDIEDFIEACWDMPVKIDGKTKSVAEWASEMTDAELRRIAEMSLEEKRKLQSEAEGVKVEIGDIDNIRETLPFLLPKQHEDVLKAEKQFFDESHNDEEHAWGKGYMFTNGTGTGKTYTGLGIAKRFIKEGKGRILIVTAQEKKINDWIRDASNMGIEAKMLENTKSKGSGVVVTQYANLRANEALLEDEFDLIIYDESHKLMENKDGVVTATAQMHHLVAMRDAESVIMRDMHKTALFRKGMELRDELEKLDAVESKEYPELTNEEKSYLRGIGGAKGIRERRENVLEELRLNTQKIEDEIAKALANEEKFEEATERSRKTKVVFLSATPFNTPMNLDYAEGYIFKYPNAAGDNGKANTREVNRASFIMDKFPSSHTRKGGSARRLSESMIADPKQSGEEEIAFSEHLQHGAEVMSGRNLDSMYDYSRIFPRLDNPIALQLNDAIESLTNGEFAGLSRFFGHLLKDYNKQTAFFEVVKCQMIIPRIKEHLAHGRKVLVFHRRVSSSQELEPPFEKGLQLAISAGMEDMVKRFAMKYNALLKWEKRLDYRFPHEQLTEAFATDADRARYVREQEEYEKKVAEITAKGGARFPKPPKLRATQVGMFNGSEAQSQREVATSEFNRDGGEQNILVAQIASAKEGISLHDTTGKHQRVEISLYLPQSPIEFIQAEGRIYRVGNRSNAIFEYPLLGVDLEVASFVAKINGRSQTSENLSLGKASRGLRDSITRGVIGSTNIPVTDNMGTGGKELDSRELQEATDYDQAIRNWNEREQDPEADQSETPDPIGYVMAELGQISKGEKVYVANAGTGGIARYVPEHAQLTATEPTMRKFARLSALTGGGGRKIVNIDFESYSARNKADAVIMEGSHGTYRDNSSLLGETKQRDLEEFVKAESHTEEGGRIVFLADEEGYKAIKARLESGNRYYEFRMRQAVVINGEALGREGKQYIITADHIENRAKREATEKAKIIDISDIKETSELLELMRNLKAPQREIDKGKRAVRRARKSLNIIKNLSTVAKTRSEGKMEADVWASGRRISIRWKRGSMCSVDYSENGSRAGYYNGFDVDVAKIGAEDYKETYRLACIYKKQLELIGMENDDMLREMPLSKTKTDANSVRESLQATNSLIEELTGKTRTQLTNIANGVVDNMIAVGDMSIDDYEDIFNGLNEKNAATEALGKRVIDGVKKIPGITFACVSESDFNNRRNVLAHYIPSKNRIELNSAWFNSAKMSDSKKAECMIHEMIHAVTCWAIEEYKNPINRLTSVQKQAVEDILNVYKNINNDGFRAKLRLNSTVNENAEYGLETAEEMIAELSNPAFRKVLKMVKLWRQLINGIKRLLGINAMDAIGIDAKEEDSESADKILNDALETLIDNFDADAYMRYTDFGIFGKEGAYESRYAGQQSLFDFEEENGEKPKKRMLYKDVNLFGEAEADANTDEEERKSVNEQVEEIIDDWEPEEADYEWLDEIEKDLEEAALTEDQIDDEAELDGRIGNIQAIWEDLARRYGEESEDDRVREVMELLENSIARLRRMSIDVTHPKKYVDAGGKETRYDNVNKNGYGEQETESQAIQNGRAGSDNDSTGADAIQRQGDRLLQARAAALNKKSGEFCLVERAFVENGFFSFTSGEKISGPDDVAYIFSALEDAAKEHAFAVLVKNGEPTVVELGVGTAIYAVVDFSSLTLAAERVKPDEIYFVHNHPSGNLIASPEDGECLRRVRESNPGIPVHGLIINLKTGHYGVFGEGTTETRDKRTPDKEYPLTVYSLDKQIFDRDYDPGEQVQIKNQEDVAKFLNSHRMGDRSKVSFLVLSRSNRVVGNIHTPYKSVTDSNAEELARYIAVRLIQFGGNNVVLYGDFEIYSNKMAYRNLGRALRVYDKSLTLLDVVKVAGNHTMSASEWGFLDEPMEEYGASTGGLRFREVEDPAVLTEFEEGKTVKAYRTMQIIDGKLYSPMATKVGGEKTPEVKLGVTEQSEEHPEIIKRRKKTKSGAEYGIVVIDKGLGKGTLSVAYNPYIHTTQGMLNDQFTSAWIRPNLVTVEVEIPQSELTSGYHAEHAKNPVGETSWHKGSVSSKLAKKGRPRTVVLTRYDKPVRIVSYREVAEGIAAQLEGTGISIPFNTVQPQVAEHLRKMGVKLTSKPSGSIGKDSGYGKAEYVTDEMIEEINSRHGAGAASDRAKEARATELGNRLGVKVNIVRDAGALKSKDEAQQVRMRRSKGWYDPASGEITVVIPNNSDVSDIEQTVLHEAVGHKGLKALVGEERFADFIRRVYEGADEATRSKIIALAMRNGWDINLATEEYIAQLAESGFADRESRGFWAKVRDFFADMLRKIKITLGTNINDTDLRYMLWRSYQMQQRGASSIIGEAERIAKESELGLGDFRYRDPGELLDKVYGARNIYEERLRTSLYQFTEAFQDSMLGLKEAYRAIHMAGGGKKGDFRIEDIINHENAYIAENAMSSVNQAEAEAYRRLVFQPLIEEIARIAKGKGDRIELTDYLIAKHGLERNAYMRASAIADGADAAKAGATDYAGLTALMGVDDVAAAEADAERFVNDYESRHDTDALWDKINQATKTTLRKVYEGGILSKEQYEKILGMYKNYVPLRGWDETTSDEIYGYLTAKNGAFGSVMKKAYGRSSKADDPIATIAHMAEQAIYQSNRNRMKQKFLNYVMNHPSDLVSISRLWLEHDDIADEWRPVFPELSENDTAAEIDRKLKDFEEKMEQLSAADPDRYKKGKETATIPYKVVKGNLGEHRVIVKRNGVGQVITINGNPRAAQALNGLTNPDTELEGWVDYMLRAGQWVNRKLSSAYTTRNPDFVVSNFLRDALYSNSMAWVKENPGYAMNFHKNFLKVNPLRMGQLFHKYRTNKIDMSKKTEAAFALFLKSGGETGYTDQRNIEAHKRAIRKELKKAQGGKVSARVFWDALGTLLDDINRAVENCARFAAFLTSREAGRSVERSIWDAKEVSVNFNKKGSGSKFAKSEGQTAIGKMSAVVSGFGKAMYVFWNAAIQGTTNFGRQARRHPAKFATLASVFFAGAIASALLGGGDDDDKNSYYNQPEYIRRSNILIKFGDQWIALPLPIELRSVYGMGELLGTIMSGQETLSDREIAAQMTAQMSQLLPLDFMEGGGGAMHTFTPSVAKPAVEAYAMNEGWTGLPIYKDSDFNKEMPEWTKAYKNANKQLTGLSEALNAWSGGDKYTQGSINFNPAQLEYMLNGYFGGYANTLNKAIKMAETASGERDFAWQNMLLANRVVKQGDDRTEGRKLNKEYYRLTEEADRTAQRLHGYRKELRMGAIEYGAKLNELYDSEEFQRYIKMKGYRRAIDKMSEMVKYTDGADRDEIQRSITELKKEMVKEMK